MARINQLVRKPRRARAKKSDVPALEGCPQSTPSSLFAADGLKTCLAFVTISCVAAWIRRVFQVGAAVVRNMVKRNRKSKRGL